jgi:hypothetical protein
MAKRPCLISASRLLSKSLLVLAKPNGSNPTSPTNEPSRAAGRVRNGNAWLITFVLDLAVVAGMLLSTKGAGGTTSSSAAMRRAKADLLDDWVWAVKALADAAVRVKMIAVVNFIVLVYLGAVDVWWVGVVASGCANCELFI